MLIFASLSVRRNSSGVFELEYVETVYGCSCVFTHLLFFGGVFLCVCEPGYNYAVGYCKSDSQICVFSSILIIKRLD